MPLLSAAVLLARQAPPTDKNPLAGNRAAIDAGAKLYAVTCQSCHGSGERAPSLVEREFTHGGTDSEIFLNIRNGIRGTQMPSFPALSTEETWQVVSYIRSLSMKVDTADTETSGGPAAGKEIFYSKGACSTCHEVNGRGGRVGPDLSSAGTRKEERLRNKILDPDHRHASHTVIARTRDGREIRGVARNEDTYSLQIVDISGQLHTLDKQKLAQIRKEERPLTPVEAAKLLSAAEVENLVAYLKTLNARDLSQASMAPLTGGLTFERIRNAKAEPQNWLTYWGDYLGTHYSPLKQINTSNVGQLQAAWAKQMPDNSPLEATPIVVDGVMYTSGPGQVFALDARTGLQIWKYAWKQRVPNAGECSCSRGVAVLGNRVFYGTLDAALLALDARTGLPLWQVQVADARDGYSITSPPLVVKDRVIVGISGGDFGIRGFVDAYDAATGKRLWRFYTIPGPGEFGHETWEGDSWKRGAGATWLTGSYDPDLDVIFWAVGNPGPDLDGTSRRGDNLFSCSVIALDPATGERKWHYQFTPGDTHDWDSTEDLVLVDRMFRGKQRKLMLHADRNGMFYVLDRTNGKLLSGTPFVRQTWNTGFDESGQPKIVPRSQSSPDGSIDVFPGSGGATNLQSPSYSPDTGWMYVAYADFGNRFFSLPQAYQPAKLYWGGWTEGVDSSVSAGIRSIDPETGKIVWDYTLLKGSPNAGVLATGGGLVFAATREGNLIALNARTGKFLWRFQTGGVMAAAPMSYAVDGRQYLAISAGAVLYAFALPE